MLFSITALISNEALEIAWRSPVKWTLILSSGSTEALPPPVAPPFIPKNGPNDGCLKQAHATFYYILKANSVRQSNL